MHINAVNRNDKRQLEPASNARSDRDKSLCLDVDHIGGKRVDDVL